MSSYKNLSEELKLVEKDKSRIPSMEKPLPDPFSTPKFTGLKITVAAAFLLSLVSLAGAVSFYQVLNSEKRKREALEATQLQVQDHAAAFEKTAEQYRTEIERMREQLKSYGAERKEFKWQIEESDRRIAGLQNKLREVEERNKVIEEQISKKADAAFSPVSPDREPSLPALPEGPSVSSKADQAAAPAVKTAKVLTVNRRFNFVVVNLGMQDKIKIGDPLDIERDGKVIGSAKVEKLYESFASAVLVKEPKEAPVKEGDLIRRPA